MTQGSLTALNIAFALMFTVLGILGQSLGTAVFPSLSALYAKGDIQEFSRTFTHTLANVLFLSIPAGLGMFILSRPIIQVLFERSEWSSADTSATSWALMFYALGLAGHTALEILARTFYALHDTWTPVIVGATAMVFNIVLSFVFVLIFEALGADTFTRGAFGGLALANSLATALESTALWFILKRRIAEIETGPVLSVFIGTLVSSLAMVSGVALWLWISDTLFPLLRLLIGIGLGMGIFWGMAMLLRVEQAHSVPRQILARFR
jgi:putative peptidoglycan lipid II flippase